MFTKIQEFAAKISPDVWLYVGLGIIGAVFLIGLILTYATGEVKQFKKGAKVLLSAPSAKTALDAAKIMPVKVKKLYKRMKTTGEKPSDVMAFDSCIGCGYATSFASRFSKVVLFTTLLTAPLISGMLLTAAEDALIKAGIGAAAVSAVGLLLTAVSAAVATAYYNGAVAIYNFYVDALDKLSKGGDFSDVDLGEAKSEVKPEVKPEKNKNKRKSDEAAFASGAASAPEKPSADSVTPGPAYMNFDAPTRLNIEIVEDDEDAPVTAAETVVSVKDEAVAAPVINSDLADIEEEIRREKEARERERETRERAEQIKVRTEQLRAARAASAASEPPAHESAVVTPPPQTRESVVTPPPQAQTRPATAAAAPNIGGSAAEIIARINRIVEQGADAQERRDAALQLSRERAKPENQNEQTKAQLKAAFDALMKSMSARK
ncbi:MAG: hypothetical protein LBP26_03720 [Clostridiales bacterium]|jgi:hypothetical protein|nr:hypothetical protein [Clostridiales bacterium]